MLAILLIVFVTRASTPPISFVDNTSGQVTANHHQLEATGGDSGNYAEDVSSSSYNLQSGASGYRLSGQLQIGGMTACNDGDTAWAEVILGPESSAWDTGVNLVFGGSSTSGTAGYGYDFWLREGKRDLGYFHTSDLVRSNQESETNAPNPRSVYFDFALMVVPTGGTGGTAYLDVSYRGSPVGSVSGAYTADLSNAYGYVGLWSGETGESEFSFLDYSTGGVEEQLDLTAVPAPTAIWLLGSGLIGLVGIRGRLGK